MTPFIQNNQVLAELNRHHGGNFVAERSLMQAYGTERLGVIGLVLMALTYGALVWRAWFFAVDRPRWDLDARRPYSALALLPTLTVAMLLVQGLAESGPIMLWGWMLVVLFSFKIKSVPLIGRGLSERDRTVEWGARERRATTPGTGRTP